MKLLPVKLDPLSKAPLVSVLIVNYNYQQYVGKSIESALNQSYKNLELIVCDDGSVDNSIEVINSYALFDNRIKTVCKKNGGVASALNAAFRESTGSIICILDADDVFLPDKIETIVNQYIQDSQTGFIIHSMMMVDASGNEIQKIPFMSKFETGWIAEKVIARGGRYRSMPASAISFRRELTKYIFPIPEESFRSTADGFIFTILPLFTNVAAVSSVMALYKIHGTNLTGSFGVSFEKSTKSIADSHRVLNGVNRQLHLLSCSERLLDPERNLAIIGHRLILLLLEGKSTTKTIRMYAKYISLLVSDDMYGRLQKVGYVIIYAIALLLPTCLRKRWLNSAFDPAKKLKLQHMVKRYKRIVQFKLGFQVEIKT